MKNFKLTHRGGYRNSTRNKGAMSLEYILIIVVVSLVALSGMKLFGSRVGDTITGATNVIKETTSSVLTDGTGGESSGGTEQENAGKLYVKRTPVAPYELATQAEKDYMVANNDQFIEESLELVQTAYFYDWQNTCISSGGYYYEDNAERVHIEYDRGDGSIGGHVGYPTEEALFFGKTYADVQVGDKYPHPSGSSEWTITSKETLTGVLDTSGDNFYKKYMVDTQLRKETDITDFTNYVLFNGTAYKYDVDGTTYYGHVQRPYIVQTDTMAIITPYDNSYLTVGSEYWEDNSIVQSSGWVDGVEVLHY